MYCRRRSCAKSYRRHIFAAIDTSALSYITLQGRHWPGSWDASVSIPRSVPFRSTHISWLRGQLGFTTERSCGGCSDQSFEWCVSNLIHPDLGAEIKAVPQDGPAKREALSHLILVAIRRARLPERSRTS